MSDETYNGWTNYPTWAVNLWMANDRGLYEQAMEIAANEYDDAPNCINVRDGIWTIQQAKRFNLADHYREWIRELSYEPMTNPLGEASVYSDLCGWALSQVNWTEVAEAWIINHEEQLEYVGGYS